MGFFLPQSHIDHDPGFHAKSGESQQDQDGWTVCLWAHPNLRTYSFLPPIYNLTLLGISTFEPFSTNRVTILRLPYLAAT